MLHGRSLHEKLDFIIEKLGAIEKNQLEYSQNSTPNRSTNQVSQPSPILTTTDSVPADTNDDAEPSDDLVRFCVETKLKNVSVTNFATILVERLFTEEERYNRNCRGGGIRKKEALDPVKLNLVKNLVFSYYTVPLSDQDKTWCKCIKAIDEKLRRPFKARYNKQ